MIGLFPDELLACNQKSLSLSDKFSLLFPECMKLLLVELDLLKVQRPLMRLLILLDLIIPIEDLDLLLQFFELSFNLL